LSQDQEQWGVAFGSFILGKQSGFDMEFSYVEQPLKKAAFYLLPCIKGHRVMSGRRWSELLERVSEGAALYISYDGGFLSGFEQLTGVRVENRFRRCGNSTAEFDLDEGRSSFPFSGEFGVALSQQDSTVIGREQDGNPVFTCSPYGKGKVFFLGYPLEIQLARTPGAFHTGGSQEYWRIYRHMLASVTNSRCIKKSHAMIGVTEHASEDASRIVVMINYSDSQVEDRIELSEGWVVDACYYGNAPAGCTGDWTICLGKNDAVVFRIIQKGDDLD
jgi:hypothetical protein